MLETLFAPKSVAVIGASSKPGKVGYDILNNIIQGGFPGPIIPVNPGSTEILGKKCYPNVKDAGVKIDFGCIVLPSSAVKQAVTDLLDAGATAITIISAGFKETGKEGAALEKEIVELVRSRGARLLGPNCLGHLNPHAAINASFAQKMPPKGDISVISQSGALLCAILDWAELRNVGMSKLVSMGNKGDLCENDFFEMLSDDPQTKVVMTYVESIADGPRFIEAATACNKKKPIVLLKSGTSAAGQKATSSHTGSLAGADSAYQTGFRRSGVVRAWTFEQLQDYCMAFALQPLPAGNRVCIVTNAGGPGAMCADAVEHGGLVVATIDPKTAAELKTKLPAAASVGNPIDVLGDADPVRYAEAVKVALNDPSVDSVIVILTPQSMTQALPTAETLGQYMKGCTKPVLAVFMGGLDVAPARKRLLELGIPDYTSPDCAVGALKAMVDYAAWRKKGERVIKKFDVDKARAEKVLQKNRSVGRMQIGEVDAKEIFRAYGFNVPAGELAADGVKAVEVANKIGYPVVMKVSSADIIHKSDVGGVKLNLADAVSVKAAYDTMMTSIKAKQPNAKIDGVYVEKMGSKGTELVVGMARDPQMGPMVMFGLGGIFVEVLKDVTFELAPMTADEAMEMLTRTKSYALLKGVRGQAGVNIAAVVEALQRLSQLVTDFPEIKELDINPMIAGGPDTVPVVADGRMTIV
jgi:acetyl coenzyme A synthetase (ADP forming)-like protein